MLVISVNNGINGKNNMIIQYGNVIFNCELDNPRICIPASGGVIHHKDVQRLIDFLRKFDKKGDQNAG